MKKIESIVSLRFIFILLIFLHHFDGFEIYYIIPTSYSVRSLLNEWGAIGVSFFFVLSGFVCSYGYRKKFLMKDISSGSFLKRRLSKIYLLYLFSGLLAIIIYKIPIKMAWTTCLPFILMIQSFVPVDNYAFIFNGAAWCIPNLMFCYIIFSILAKQKAKIFSYSLIGVIFLEMLTMLIMGGGGDGYNISWFFYINPVFRLSDFLVGMIGYELYNRLNKGIPLPSKVICMEVFSVLFLCGCTYFAIKYNVSMIYRYSLYYLIPIISLIISFSLEGGYLSKAISNPVFKWLGEISMEIYLFHQIILTLLGRLFSNWLINIHRAFVIGTIAFVVTVLLSWIWKKFIQNKCSNICDWIFNMM